MRIARCVHLNCLFSGERADVGGSAKYKILA
jgi:hypothetical protein